jgi:hypothetical protein
LKEFRLLDRALFTILRLLRAILSVAEAFEAMAELSFFTTLLFISSPQETTLKAIATQKFVEYDFVEFDFVDFVATGNVREPMLKATETQKFVEYDFVEFDFVAFDFRRHMKCA